MKVGSRFFWYKRYYVGLVEIKDFNILFNNKLFFKQPVKKMQQGYEKLAKMSRNDDFTTGNL